MDEDDEVIGWTYAKHQAVDPNYGGGFFSDDPQVREEAQRRLQAHVDRFDELLKQHRDEMKVKDND